MLDNPAEVMWVIQNKQVADGLAGQIYSNITCEPSELSQTDIVSGL